MSQYTLVVDKWQVRPEPKWVFLKEHIVNGRETPKRILVVDGPYKGKVFDRQTGAVIEAAGIRSWYRYSLRLGS